MLFGGISLFFLLPVQLGHDNAICLYSWHAFPGITCFKRDNHVTCFKRDNHDNS